MDLTIGNGNFGNTRCDGNGLTMEENPFNYNPLVLLDVSRGDLGEDADDQDRTILQYFSNHTPHQQVGFESVDFDELKSAIRIVKYELLDVA